MYFDEVNDDDFRALCAEDDARREADEWATDSEEGFELPEDADYE